MDYSKLYKQLEEMNRLYYKMEENITYSKEFTGEVKKAFDIVVKDYLWKFNQSAGKLQFEIIKQVQTVENRVLGTTLSEAIVSEQCDAKEEKFNKTVLLPATICHKTE